MTRRFDHDRLVAIAARRAAVCSVAFVAALVFVDRHGLGVVVRSAAAFVWGLSVGQLVLRAVIRNEDRKGGRR